MVSVIGHLYASVWRVSLRLATPDDSDLLLRWRNDPLTRQNSHCIGEVDQHTHHHWLVASLANPARVIFIGEADGAPVGTVRCDWKHAPPDRVELSWTVAPEFRGRGYGTELVRAAADTLGACDLYAEIKATNAASLAIARRAGMRQVGYENGLTFWLRNRKPGPRDARSTTTGTGEISARIVPSSIFPVDT